MGWFVLIAVGAVIVWAIARKASPTGPRATRRHGRTGVGVSVGRSGPRVWVNRR